MDLELKGKTAVVTGSTAGIGLAIAGELAREGVTVVVAGRTRSKVDGAVTESHAYGHGAGPHAMTDGGALVYDQRGRQTHAPGRDVTAYTSFDLPRQVVTAVGVTEFR